MSDTYMQYENEDTGLIARWHGGEYIDLGFIDSGEFVAQDVINVWDHAKDEATIDFTPAALAECVEDHLRPWSSEDDDDE